jgi:hypothetical protein
MHANNNTHLVTHLQTTKPRKYSQTRSQTLARESARTHTQAHTYNCKSQRSACDMIVNSTYQNLACVRLYAFTAITRHAAVFPVFSSIQIPSGRSIMNLCSPHRRSRFKGIFKNKQNPLQNTPGPNAAPCRDGPRRRGFF